MRIFAAIALLAIAGCASPFEQRRAAYVRDPSHHCKLYGFSSPERLLDSWGNVTVYHGSKVFHCDGIAVVIFDDEVQP